LLVLAGSISLKIFKVMLVFLAPFGSRSVVP